MVQAAESGLKRTYQGSREPGHGSKKKSWGQAVTNLCEQHGLSVKVACKLFGHCRQAYYQQRSDYISRSEREAEIVDVVKDIRGEDPGIGTYKLWLMTKGLFTDGWFPGRDKFFELMTKNHQVLPTPRPRHTTNSNHRYHKYKNLIKGLTLTFPNQLWVSDITYIELERGCCYLHLVTDAYSHMIVGWVLADSLHAAHSIKALEMAIKRTGQESLWGLIHHSDRGVQYCCNDYVAKLKEYHIEISMTEDYKPTDNAIAERVNGIIKQEMVYRESRFRNLTEARQRMSRFIDFYNNERPHMSIGMKTPAEVYGCKTDYISPWKNNFQQNIMQGQ